VDFIVKRLAAALATLLLVSLLTFAAFALIPGDAAALILGVEATEAQLAALRAEMGLDKNFVLRYGSWLADFFTGNLGNSARFRGESIAGLIGERLPVTAALAFLSLALILLLSIPTALFAAGRERARSGRLVNTLTMITISFPNFFLGMLLIWVFGVLLKLFAPGAYIPPEENLAGFWVYLFFPALAIALPNAAIVIKFLRTSILQQLRLDYVRTAYSKGASRSLALYRHALRNAVIPAVTLLGMIIAEIFSGSIIIEQVFTIPGIGRLLIAAIRSRDYPLTQTLTVYIAAVVILANTLVDIAIQLIDPRIRLSIQVGNR
jgi:ABC-type dipeptide/oligopeptide/nickel transport system permease component